MEEKICLYCGKSFIAKSKRQIFCCTSCAAKYHNKKRRPNKPPKNCVICGKEFIPWNKNQVTCGSKECMRQNELNWKKKKRGTYKHNKNEGLVIPPTTKRKRKKSWKDYTPEERWERMTWLELSAELARLHIKYGQAQVLKLQGKLPDDFGLGCR